MEPLRRFAPLALLTLLAGAGCTTRSQLTALQTENRRLSEQSKSQLAEIDNLKVHARKIEDEMLKAEEDLARSGIDRKQLANLRGEREQLLRRRVMGPDGNPIPVGVSGQLAELARKYPSLHYDPETGISKLDTDILFDSGEAKLKPAAEKLLAELAGIIESAEAKGLKLMVVGHTDNQKIKGAETRSLYPSNWHLSGARALAVAEKLRTAGVSGDRMGVAGFGEFQPIASNSSSDTRQRNRRVEIFVMSPEVPVVGMTDTLSNLY